jgi:hypothetical protein
VLLARLVRPGGVVSFQEFNITRARSVPPTPVAARTMGWIIAALRAAGTAFSAPAMASMALEAGRTDGRRTGQDGRAITQSM